MNGERPAVRGKSNLAAFGARQSNDVRLTRGRVAQFEPFGYTILILIRAPREPVAVRRDRRLVPIDEILVTGYLFAGPRVPAPYGAGADGEERTAVGMRKNSRKMLTAEI